LKSGLLKHDIGHIIFEYFFTRALNSDIQLHSDQHESVFSSGDTVVKDITKNNLFMVVDTLLGDKVSLEVEIEGF